MGGKTFVLPRMIKSYQHIIWDWNGTIFCDVDLGIEIMNGLLRQRGLPLLTRLSYRDQFTIPVKDYYARLGRIRNAGFPLSTRSDSHDLTKSS